MSAAHSDRNLLFGVLALQMDFLGRDALLAAMHAWVIDKSKPLGEILVEQQALRPDSCTALPILMSRPARAACPRRTPRPSRDI